MRTFAKNWSAFARGYRTPNKPIFAAIKAKARLSIKKYSANIYQNFAKLLLIKRNIIVKTVMENMLK